MSIVRYGRNSSNMMSGDFLVREDGVGVKGFKNIEAMKERKEEEANLD